MPEPVVVCPFVLDGRTFATAEHYMMWRKAMLFDDPISAQQILRVSHPRQAKELGRGVAGFDQSRRSTRGGLKDSPAHPS
jgi:ribA/ribD-fused uncharacterized protein